MEMQTRGAKASWKVFRPITRNIRYEAQSIRPSGLIFCEGVHPELGLDDFHNVVLLSKAIDHKSDW